MRSLRTKTLPFLPLVNAAQAIQARVEHVSFQGGQGVRYLTQLNQGLVPINNRELFYTFQGLTGDGRYYVVAILPVAQSLLPADAASVPQAEQEAMAADFKQYLADVTKTLNAQGDAGFAPALTDLDALVRSIEVDSPAGQSLAGQVHWGGQPVAGVRVELRKPGWRSAPGANDVVAATVSDAAGRYVFQNPPAGDWSLCAVWPDGEESQGGTPAVLISAGQAIPAGPDTTLMLARTLALVEPAFGARVGTSPALRWEDFPGAAHFRVWVVDAGTSALLVDQAITGTSFTVTPALRPGTKYEVVISALDDTSDQLAIGKGEFWTGGDAPVATPASPDPAEGLPPDCQPHSVPGGALYADPAGRYCFVYPARYVVETAGLGQQAVELGVFGPALDESADPLRAAMLIAVSPVDPGTDLKAAVDGFLKQFEGMPGVAMVKDHAIERQEYAMGGGPAELLDGVPGYGGSRDIFFLTNDGERLYHFIFTPSGRDYPQAQADVEELFGTITGHFAFLMP